MPDEATIERLIRKGTIAQSFVPLVCGTAFKNKGVQPLLDAVMKYLPSPLDIEAVQVGLALKLAQDASSYILALSFDAADWATSKCSLSSCVQ